MSQKAERGRERELNAKTKTVGLCVHCEEYQNLSLQISFIQLVEILTTFLMTGYENNSPITNEMRQMADQMEDTQTLRLNLDKAEQKIVKQSMFRRERKTCA